MTEITALLSSVAPGALRAPAGVAAAPDFSLLLSGATLIPAAANTTRQTVAAHGTPLPVAIVEDTAQAHPTIAILPVAPTIALTIALVGRVLVDPAEFDAVVVEPDPALPESIGRSATSPDTPEIPDHSETNPGPGTFAKDSASRDADHDAATPLIETAPQTVPSQPPLALAAQPKTLLDVSATKQPVGKPVRKPMGDAVGPLTPCMFNPLPAAVPAPTASDDSTAQIAVALPVPARVSPEPAIRAPSRKPAAQSAATTVVASTMPLAVLPDAHAAPLVVARGIPAIGARASTLQAAGTAWPTASSRPASPPVPRAASKTVDVPVGADGPAMHRTVPVAVPPALPPAFTAEADAAPHAVDHTVPAIEALASTLRAAVTVDPVAPAWTAPSTVVRSVASPAAIPAATAITGHSPATHDQTAPITASSTASAALASQSRIASEPHRAAPSAKPLIIDIVDSPARARKSADDRAESPVAQPPTARAQPTTRAPVAMPAAQAFAGAMFAVEPARPRPVARGSAAELAMIAGIDLSSTQPSAPAAIAAASHPIDTARADWIETMIDRIDMLSATGGSERRETRIRLNPDQLGSVEIAIERDGDTTNLRFTAETAATRTLLADAAPRLAEIADARGLRLGQTQVDLGANTAQSHAQQQQQRQSDPRHEPNRLAPAPTPAADDAADTTDRLA